ncbi:ARF GAP with effector function(s) [Balamuthia mandrillaris]
MQKEQAFGGIDLLPCNVRSLAAHSKQAQLVTSLLACMGMEQQGKGVEKSSRLESLAEDREIAVLEAIEFFQLLSPQGSFYFSHPNPETVENWLHAIGYAINAVRLRALRKEEQALRRRKTQLERWIKEEMEAIKRKEEVKRKVEHIRQKMEARKATTTQQTQQESLATIQIATSASACHDSADVADISLPDLKFRRQDGTTKDARLSSTEYEQRLDELEYLLSQMKQQIGELALQSQEIVAQSQCVYASDWKDNRSRMAAKRKSSPPSQLLLRRNDSTEGEYPISQGRAVVNYQGQPNERTEKGNCTDNTSQSAAKSVHGFHTVKEGIVGLKSSSFIPSEDSTAVMPGGQKKKWTSWLRTKLTGVPWTDHYLVLKSDGNLYLYMSRHDYLLGQHLLHRVQLLLACVREYDFSSTSDLANKGTKNKRAATGPYWFEVITSERNFLFCTETYKDRATWLRFINSEKQNVMSAVFNETLEQRQKTFKYNLSQDSKPIRDVETVDAISQGQRAVLRSLLSLPGNNVCADCNTPDPRWASTRYGVFLCIDCCGIHRGLPGNRLKSLALDVWEDHDVEAMENEGNLKANAKREKHLPPDFIRPIDAMQRRDFIHRKYLQNQESS